MNIIEIIEKKKRAEILSKEEIEYFVSSYMDDRTKDYQASALLMAICLNGMTMEEIFNLTMAMRDSGKILDLSRFSGRTFDKHSTGGVGDKTSLIIGPILASLGLKMVKMSGRGLGHTGGTIDKMESIGMTCDLDIDRVLEQVEDIGLGIISQSENFTPADKKLYALRDVTGTVDSIPLIASSIMSKKLAFGADRIVLDVKVGSGAFMKTLDKAEGLSKTMVEIGRLAGVKTKAEVTNMDEPLGYMVGNRNEIYEVVQVLKGQGERELTELSIKLAAYIYQDSENIDLDLAEEKISDQIKNGQALEYFKKLLVAQKGDISFLENPEKLLESKYTLEIKSEKSGIISKMDAEKIGRSASLLGAGRKKLGDELDFTAGIELKKKVGDRAEKGEVIALMRSGREEFDEAQKLFLSALEYGNKVEKKNLTLTSF